MSMAQPSNSMDEIPIYGLDKELAEKAAASYDVGREESARDWIEEITGESFPVNNFQESLKDGVILCKLINKLGVSPKMLKPTTSKMPFHQMENINAFLNAINEMGVQKFEQFQTIDLFEGKNLKAVVDCIFAVSRNAAKMGFKGRLLGPKLAEKRSISFSDEQLYQARNMIPKQAGFAKGATASGVSFGKGRAITYSKPI